MAFGISVGVRVSLAGRAWCRRSGSDRVVAAALSTGEVAGGLGQWKGMNHGTELTMGEPIGKQSVRQTARRAALDAQAKIRANRVEREKRLSALGVAVMVALAQRDGFAASCELRAGEALRAMTEDEGLTLREAVTWCGEDMTRREATRLRRLVDGAGRERGSATATATGEGRSVVKSGAPASD